MYKVKDYYKSGQLQMSGTFTSKRLKKKTGPFTYFHENGNKDAEGNFNKDKREGEWIWYHENGAKSSIEKFSKGKRKTANFFDVNGGEVSLEEAEQEPRYLGTDKEFLEYITSNVKYPDQAKRNNEVGRVVLQLRLDENGNVYEISVIETPSVSLAKEAIRVARTIPKYRPAKAHNRYMKSVMFMPVNFQLTEGDL